MKIVRNFISFVRGKCINGLNELFGVQPDTLRELLPFIIYGDQ